MLAVAADGEVAQDGHGGGAGAGAGANLGVVLGEHDVADLVQPVLDRPVSADELGELDGADVAEGQVRDGVDGFGAPAAGAATTSAAGDLGGEAGVWERNPRPDRTGDGGELEAARLDPSVPALSGVVQDGNLSPGQPG